MRLVVISAFSLAFVVVSSAYAQQGEQGEVIYQSGFRMQNSEDYSLQISGHVRTDFRYVDYPAESPIQGESVQTFDVNQSLINVDAFLMEYYQASISVNFAKGARLNSGFVGFNFSPNFQLKLGQFGYPFGSEDLSSSTYAAFLQTTTISNAVASVTARGLSISGNPFDGIIHYQVGVLADQSTSNESNPNLDLVTRLVVYPTQPFSDFFHTWLGVSFAAGESAGVDDVDIYLSTETGSGTPLVIADIPTGLAYNRLKLGLDATMLIGPFMLKGEYLSSQLTFDNSVSISGGYVIASVFLTGEQRSVMRGLLARQEISAPFDPELGEWGAWEVAARYSWLSVDDALFQAGGLYSTWPGISRVSNMSFASGWALGVNWYLHSMVSVMFDVMATVAQPAFTQESQFSEYAFMSGVHIEF